MGTERKTDYHITVIVLVQHYTLVAKPTLDAFSAETMTASQPDRALQITETDRAVLWDQHRLPRLGIMLRLRRYCLYEFGKTDASLPSGSLINSCQRRRGYPPGVF